MNEYDLYAGREQTLVKHYILEHYLERFAHIVGSTWDDITYVDCFAGPWNARSDEHRDSSFALALTQLRQARRNPADLKAARSRPQLELRCFFLERDPAAFARLRGLASRVADAEIELRNATLEQSIDDILAFVRKRQRDAFALVFLDPTGWTGFGLDVIAPLLRHQPGEVLVNFMTGYTVRFAEQADEAIRRSFDRLFGPVDYRRRIARLAGQDREEELVHCYADAIGWTGSFDYVCPAIVLLPEKNRTHFHLLYATRNARGVEVFKQVEKKAMAAMEMARAEARRRSRIRSSRQEELFAAQQLHDSAYYESLRDRHTGAARAQVKSILVEGRTVDYDDVWAAALSHPLVWKSDVDAWIDEWKKAGRVELTGLKPRERVPKLDAGHQLLWRNP
ncbi:MAG: three-Cys-motif partner protein TcmP [Phycisphaerales bacterium]|nr:MAG: three-Cys-motif partner protein TcmP [Phycisphaerales bacterium]